MEGKSIHLQTELGQFSLDVGNDLLLEHLALLEDLVHAHSRDDHPSLTLDDALHDVLHVAAAAAV